MAAGQVTRRRGYARWLYFIFGVLILVILAMTIHIAWLLSFDSQYTGNGMVINNNPPRQDNERLDRLEMQLKESFRLVESQKSQIEDLEKSIRRRSLQYGQDDVAGLTSRIERLEAMLPAVNGTATNSTNDADSTQDRLEDVRRHEREAGYRAQKMQREVAQIKQDFYSELYSSKPDDSSIQELLTDNFGNRFVNPIYPYSDTFCHPWRVSYDRWWTHHPEWTVSKESDDDYCFSQMKPSTQSQLFRTLYDIQFRGNCDQVISKKMMSSGWGVDMANLVDGLLAANELKRPFQPTQDPWHYANDKKNASNAVCPQKNMNCYFLPLSRCDPNEQRVYPGTFYYKFQPKLDEMDVQYLLDYITRPQTWLRKEVYDFSKTINVTSPCTVMHVRRGDVVLHKDWARKYYAIEEYMTASTKITNDILLLTDDANAVEEARAKFPDYNWITIDRQRFRGNEGGWENHIPSNNAKQEVVVLLSIFRLVKQCNVFVHSRSNLAEYLAGIMTRAQNRRLIRVDLNKGHSDRQIYSANNAETAQVSRTA